MISYCSSFLNYTKKVFGLLRLIYILLKKVQNTYKYGFLQGRVRTKTVKKASRQLVEKYYQRLTLDFHTNKRLSEEVAEIQTKRLRNKIAGFTTVSHWSFNLSYAFLFVHMRHSE